MEQKDKYELIYLLRDSGYKILSLDGRYYIVTQFTPADGQTPYHALKGRDVTDEFFAQPNFRRMNESHINKFVAKIEKAQKVNIKFHKSYEWKLYLP